MIAVLAGVNTGCATSGESRPSEPTAAVAATHGPPAFKHATFQHDMSPVGDVIRLFGEQVGGGIVLMSGLEERAMPAIELRNTPYQDAVGQFAASVDCTYLYTPYYYMIVAPGYESLQDVCIQDALDDRYHSMSASVVLGAKTELYNAFSALSKSVGATIVADNFIAEARTGEMFLHDAPFHVVLEAILQSARIAPGAFVVESGPEYIFIRSQQNADTGNRLLNAGALTREQRTLLSTVVSLTLPDSRAVSHAAFTSIPIPLHDALLPLTEQMGVEIVAQRHLADIPINPCVMDDVRLETALNLLLWQWPMPDFGFEVQENRILIRER